MTTTRHVPRHLPYRVHYQQPDVEPGRTEYGIELTLELAHDTEDFGAYALLGLLRRDLTDTQIRAKVDDLIDLSEKVDEDGVSFVERQCRREDYRDALRAFVGAL